MPTRLEVSLYLFGLHDRPGEPVEQESVGAPRRVEVFLDHLDHEVVVDLK